MDVDEPVSGGSLTAGEEAERMSAPDVSSSFFTDSRSPLEERPRQKSTRRLVVGIVIALVVVLAGGGLAVALMSAPTTISTGTGSATITWTQVTSNSDTVGASPPQPFTGTIEGMSASGVATMPVVASGVPSTSPTATFPTKLEVVKWTGTFGGKSFNVGIFVHYPSTASITNPTASFPTITIVGQWGSDPVNGTVEEPTAAELKGGTGPIHFNGTVGDFKVSGTVQQPTGTTHRQSLATFAVTK